MSQISRPASALCLCIAALLLPPTTRAEGPNIIMIVTDDMGYADIGYTGSGDVITPNIDALINDGVFCSAGYVTAPQCAPSRAGLITGVYQARFGYFDNSNHRGLPDGLPTVADYAKSAGYVTGVIGKWHIGGEGNAFPSREEPSKPWNRGFDYTLIHDRGMSHYFPFRSDGINWMTSRGREYRLTEVVEGTSSPVLVEDYAADDYLTDIFTDEAKAFITRHQNEPFFLYLAYNAPHTPLVTKDEDYAANAHIADPERRKLAAMMTAVDRGVLELRSHLAALNLTNDTLIIFFSDNGGPNINGSFSNLPFSGWKGDMLEGGIRTPMCVTWPSVLARNQIYDEPVISVDFVPMIARLAGTGPVSDAVDGVDFWDNLKRVGQPAPPVTPRSPIFWRWRSRLVMRDGDEKLLEPGASIPQAGLYDIVTNFTEDPGLQLNDPNRLAQMESVLFGWDAGNASTIASVPGDCDTDAFVIAETDGLNALDCLTGVDIANPAGCICADSDLDGDNDLADVAKMLPWVIGTPPAAQDPIIHYDFEETSGTILDSGVGDINTDGTLEGVTPPDPNVTGRFGSGIRFVDTGNDADGDGGSLRCGTAAATELKVTSDFTCTLWVKLDRAPQLLDRLIDSTNADGSVNIIRGWRLLMNDLGAPRKLVLHANQDGAGDRVKQTMGSLRDMPIDEWVFIAVRYDTDGDAQVTLLYDSDTNVDAAFIQTHTQAVPAVGPLTYGANARPRLGSKQSGNGAYLDGLLDEFRLYERVLDDAALAGLYLNNQ